VTDAQAGLREALKLVAVALKEGEVPFALAGGYALWARGAPEPHHDVDFAVAEEDRDRVAALLAEHGLEVADPPEDWLFKVFVDGAMVDLIFRANGEPVTHDYLAASDELEVESVLMPVLSATALVQAKLNALDERSCDLGKVIPAARAVREQVDWPEVAEAVAGNDFAVVTLDLLARLRVVAGNNLPT
jgi:aminoglycoside-2''-adenylyltransferase